MFFFAYKNIFVSRLSLFTCHSYVFVKLREYNNLEYSMKFHILFQKELSTEVDEEEIKQEEQQLSASYQQVSLHLLDLCSTLHNQIPTIFAKWATAGAGETTVWIIYKKKRKQKTKTIKLKTVANYRYKECKMRNWLISLHRKCSGRRLDSLHLEQSVASTSAGDGSPRLRLSTTCQSRGAHSSPGLVHRQI